MDRLSRNAMLARQAGMSYGKWKALQPIVPIVKKKIPDGWKECEGCGKVFKPGDPRQRFCDIGCRNEAYYQRRRELLKEYAKKKYREKKVVKNEQ